MRARTAEAAFVLIIASAVLLGGPAVLGNLERFRLAAFVALAVIAAALFYGIGRRLGAGGRLARLRVSRDVAFLASAGSAMAFVLAPGRWAVGACVTALEFGLVLELLSMLAPAPPAPSGNE